MKRGIISLDANAIAQARKAIKRASSDGHDRVYTRFTRDRTYALRMIEAGYNQHTMRQSDALIQAILSNPGRHHSQRRLAQGSSSRDPTGTPSSNDLRPARFVFFDEEMKNYQEDNEIHSTSTLGDRLYRAGLVDNTTDLPVAIAWFGSFFSLSEFARLAARSKVADQPLTFGADHQPLNLTSSDALLMQLQGYAKDVRSMQKNAPSRWRSPTVARPRAKASPRTKRRASRGLSHTARGVMAKAGMAVITTKGVGTKPTTPHQA